MYNLTKDTLTGTWGTLLLPIQKNNAIDFPILEEEIDYLIESRLEGIYSNGSAGEFHNQTEEEFDKISSLLAEKCHAASYPFQLGVSHMSPWISRERLLRCVPLKPSAFQVILPDWVVPNGKEQLLFLQEMAELAGDIPLVLYNPPHAKASLTVGDFEKISNEISHLIGIKVADGDQEWYADMKKLASMLSIFVPGHHLATGMASGVARGSYSNVACLSPRGAKVWYELMQSDLEEALKIENGIHLFFAQYVVPFQSAGYSNPALDKGLAAIGDWVPVGLRLRWPYLSIPSTELPELKKKARRMLPSFFFQ